jgi:predicted RNA binding protein YcfA (HicA-like mRNA interferase family)
MKNSSGALVRNGWVVVRQRGSHLRLQKTSENETFKLTIPAHKPIKRSTLSHILKQAHLTTEELLRLL